MVVTLIVSVAIITAIATLLALLLVIADATVGNYGDVSITINNERELIVPGGQPLLSLLVSEGIFIPSACGGRGSCGLCKVQVVEGEGPTSPPNSLG